jgi:hypothetical protein
MVQQRLESLSPPLTAAAQRSCGVAAYSEALRARGLGNAENHRSNTARPRKGRVTFIDTNDGGPGARPGEG